MFLALELSGEALISFLLPMLIAHQFALEHLFDTMDSLSKSLPNSAIRTGIVET